jgi:hypothetical protein
LEARDEFIGEKVVDDQVRKRLGAVELVPQLRDFRIAALVDQGPGVGGHAHGILVGSGRLLVASGAKNCSSGGVAHWASPCHGILGKCFKNS